VGCIRIQDELRKLMILWSGREAELSGQDQAWEKVEVKSCLRHSSARIRQRVSPRRRMLSDRNPQVKSFLLYERLLDDFEQFFL
jgi:hypothetical protein